MIKSFLALAAIIFIVTCTPSLLAQNQQVWMGGNSWAINGGSITNQGFSWKQTSASSFYTYIYTNRSGLLSLALNLTNTSPVNVTISIVGGSSYVFSNIAPSSTFVLTNTYTVGFAISKTGYIQILAKINSAFTSNGTISTYLVRNSTGYLGNSLSFVTYDPTFTNFYWGRRGPSCHLWYQIPSSAKISYFYNQITVPAGYDTIGSYFMAIGFGQGYFGMQVNGPKQRRILFSVWSPHQGDSSVGISPSEMVNKTMSGSGVHVGTFGGQGNGGQSYLVYNWKPNKTYRFVVGAVPNSVDGSTVFTAWFFDPEVNVWKLIAGFKRPKTVTYLTGVYSFIQNFDTAYGNITRKAYYGNQWYLDVTSNKFTQVNHATFTIDSTGSHRQRLDYAGGVMPIQKSFFLQNTGFFNTNTAANTVFLRPSTGGQGPSIGRTVLNVSSLPKS